MSRIVELWRRMAAMYGHTWASQYGTQPEGTAADTWAAALAGLTGPQIAEGLRACVVEGEEFPPNAPRFRAMCCGIPSLARVRLEFTQGDAERSPFTRSVWMLIDGYAYRHASARDSDRMLRDAYELAREQAMRGVALPEASKAVGHEQPRLPTLANDRQARCEHLQHVLGPFYNPAVADPDYDPAKAHRSAVSPEERRAAEALLAAHRPLHHTEEDLP